MDNNTELPGYLVEIASKFKERKDALGYKGKKLDDAALDFFIGAAVGARAAGNDDIAKHIEAVAALLVAVRGYVAVSEILKKAGTA